MVTQPEGRPRGYISAHSWTGLLGDWACRDGFLKGLSYGDSPKNLTHWDYKPLWPLIRSLAAILVVDRHWLPKSDARKHPGYICEAFQRLILQFIISNRYERFMTCRVDDSLREVGSALTRPASTPSEIRDGLDRDFEAKRRRFDRTEVGCVCAIFEFLSFLLLCSQDEDDNESSRMIQ
jgi:hypothetical protein